MNDKFLAIREWADDERPRERLEKHGAGVLSTAELLAIFLRTGTRNQTAVDVSRELLKGHDGLSHLSRSSVQELCRFKGVGKAKAVSLLAIFELARRIESQNRQKKTKVKKPADVANRYLPFMRDLNREVFKVVLLDSANQIIKDVTITKGTLNSSLVHPREIFKTAIDHMAAGIILLHNHPSGNPEPSAEDISITQQIKEAGELLSIPVLDHIIIAGQEFTSMAELGHL